MKQLMEKQYEHNGHVFDESALHTGNGYTENDLAKIRALAVGETHLLEGSGAAGRLLIRRLPDVPDTKKHNLDPFHIGEPAVTRNAVTARPGTTEQKQWHTGLEHSPAALHGQLTRPD